MYYCTNHTPPPSHLAVQKKNPNIQNNTARAFSFFFFYIFLKENTNPHHEMQHKPKNIDKGITMC